MEPLLKAQEPTRTIAYNSSVQDEDAGEEARGNGLSVNLTLELLAVLLQLKKPFISDYFETRS